MSHLKRVGPVPDISIEEGLPAGTLNITEIEESRRNNPEWSKGLPWWDRLHYYQPWCKARANVLAKQPFAPQNELDLVLQSTYNHKDELFPEKVDLYFQPITTRGDYNYPELRDGKVTQRGAELARPAGARPIHPYNRVEKDYPPDKKYTPSQEDKAQAKLREVNRISLGGATGELQIFCVPTRPYMHHHVINGGMRERRNVYNVRLGLSTDHTPQTKDGYGRTPNGGMYAI